MRYAIGFILSGVSAVSLAGAAPVSYAVEEPELGPRSADPLGLTVSEGGCPVAHVVRQGAREVAVVDQSRQTPFDGILRHRLAFSADGTGLQQLTRAQQGNCYCPSWSPDGQRRCVASWRDGYSSLYVIEADGSSEVRLTDAEGVDDGRPARFPDGETIAFSRADGTDDLWLVDVATRQAHPMTSDGGLDYRPTWSPDGRCVASRQSQSEHRGVYVMTSCGGTVRCVTRGRDPCWRPCSGWIAISHGESLWAITVDEAGRPTGNPVHLTFHPSAVDRYPSWSPDRTRIAFEREEVREKGVSCRIMAVPVGAGEPRDLSEGRMPDWSPADYTASDTRRT